MNKLYGHLGYCVSVMLLLGLTSCKKFVDINPPTTEILSTNVFSDAANATAAQTAIYTKMEYTYESYNMALSTGLLGDELANNSSTSTMIEYYTNSMLSKDIAAPWTNAFNYIYQANAVISGLITYGGGIPVSITSQLIGEAEFTRAFWDFYLTQCYGSIPLVTTPGYSVNALMGRTPQKEIYSQIIADLKDAENKLNSNYVDGSDTTITSDKVRPTKWAAAALLARAYLFNGSYDSAKQQASAVINNTTLFSLCSSLDNVFLANSTEAIWQLPPVQPGSNQATPDGTYFILIAAPAKSGTTNTAVVSPQLLSSFEVNDKRMMQWIGAYIHNGTSYYFPNKYKLSNVSGAATENTMVLRLAEQYLIRAEAEANLGDSADAINDLNVIRTRAGLANYNPTINGPLLSAIWHERQVELFTEWGARWFDLNRTNMINNVMGVVTPSKGGVWNSSSALFPIPLSELSADPNLAQNSNY